MTAQTTRISDLEGMAQRMRLKAIELGGIAGEMGKGVHFGGSLSAIEMMAVLYGSILRFDPANMESSERDRLFVGKAHCILAQFTAMNEVGIITDEQLDAFRVDGSPLVGYQKNPSLGFEYHGGSLGTACSYAMGVALALKQKGSNSHVYCLIGDGECDEGVIWESIMAAAQFKLDNVTLLIDRNHMQLDGPTEKILALDDLKQKLVAFGWDVSQVDGHSTRELEQALRIVGSGKPRAIIAQTVKGKGISFMEGNPIWHQRRITKAEYEQAMQELTGGTR